MIDLIDDLIDALLDSKPGILIGGFILGIGATCGVLSFYGALRILIDGPCK